MVVDAYPVTRTTTSVPIELNEVVTVFAKVLILKAVVAPAVVSSLNVTPLNKKESTNSSVKPEVIPTFLALHQAFT